MRVSVKDTLAQLPVGGYCDFSANDVQREVMRSCVYNIKVKTGMAFSVSALDKNNYRVTRNH